MSESVEPAEPSSHDEIDPKLVPPDIRTAAEKKGEFLAYATSVVILIFGGAMLRTPILNWISGPAIVIACVVFLTPLYSKMLGAKQ